MADSQTLTVITDFHTFGEIIIGPNDGYDIGLMTVSREVKILANGEIVEGKLIIDNKCKDLTVRINRKLFEKIGSPAKIKLTLNENNLIIHS